jgi:hypothetical protein
MMVELIVVDYCFDEVDEKIDEDENVDVVVESGPPESLSNDDIVPVEQGDIGRFR